MWYLPVRRIKDNDMFVQLPAMAARRNPEPLMRPVTINKYLGYTTFIRGLARTAKTITHIHINKAYFFLFTLRNRLQKARHIQFHHFCIICCQKYKHFLDITLYIFKPYSIDLKQNKH